MKKLFRAIVNSFRPTRILLSEAADIDFACIAQGATVDRTTFPSGYKAPEPRDGKHWRIRGIYLVLE